MDLRALAACYENLAQRHMGKSDYHSLNNSPVPARASTRLANR